MFEEREKILLEYSKGNPELEKAVNSSLAGASTAIAIVSILIERGILAPGPEWSGE